MIEKSTDISAPVHDLILNRWSGVSFDPDRAINHDDLVSIAEAGRWAPSCFGDQPWRILFCNKHGNGDSAETAWQNVFDCLTEGNRAWCKQVPVLAVICADSQFSKNDKPNTWGAYDSGAAAVSMCLQARHLGLMTHQMAGFDADLIREKFSIPARYRVMAMMAIGYQIAEDHIPDGFRDRELKPRVRDPLGEHFFLGSWGKGLR